MDEIAPLDTLPRIQAAASGLEPDIASSDADSAISDAEREQHIVDLGWLMLDAYARYESTSDLQYRGEADRYRILQAEAIRARRPGYVASLEAARGIAA